MTAQARELCTGYGPLACWWWDMPVGHEDEASRLKFAAVDAMIRRLQPYILMNNRAGLPGDFDTPEQYIPADRPGPPRRLAQQWEACVTLTTGHGSFPPTAWWGYDKNETEYKTPSFASACSSTSSPRAATCCSTSARTPDGRIGEPELRVLKAMGEWLDVNGKPSTAPPPAPSGTCRSSAGRRSKATCCICTSSNWPSNRRIVLPGLMNQVRGAKLLARSQNSDANPDSLSVSRDEIGVVVQLPAKAPDAVASVIACNSTARRASSRTPSGNRPMTALSCRHLRRNPRQTRPAGPIRGGGRRRLRHQLDGANDRVCWQFEVAKPGRYDVIVNYGADRPRRAVSSRSPAGPATVTPKTGRPADDTSIGRSFELPANPQL